jgi:hypothetical protein
MKKYVNISAKKIAVLFLLILVPLSVSGCATVGRLASDNNRILFTEKGANQGVYSHGRLTVNYSYSLDGKNLTLDGNVNYPGNVDFLNVYISAIDATGSVLQQNIIYSSGYRVSSNWATHRSFKETFVIPPGTAGMSFSYSSQPRNK